MVLINNHLERGESIILVSGMVPLLVLILLDLGLYFAGFCRIVVSCRAAGRLGVRARGQHVVMVLGTVVTVLGTVAAVG